MKSINPNFEKVAEVIGKKPAGKFEAASNNKFKGLKKKSILRGK